MIRDCSYDETYDEFHIVIFRVILRCVYRVGLCIRNRASLCVKCDYYTQSNDSRRGLDKVFVVLWAWVSTGDDYSNLNKHHLRILCGIVS